MTTQALNYLRQASEDLRQAWVPAMKRDYPIDAMVCETILNLAPRIPKFVMPKGGRIFNDALRGLPDELRLPYPAILIEYEALETTEGIVEQVFGNENTVSCSKRIVIAQEVDGWIHVHSLVYINSPERPSWIMPPYAAAIRRVANSQATPGIPGLNYGTKIDGLEFSPLPTGTLAKEKIGPNWTRHAYCDLADEVSTVLELIEALSCINVTHEPLPTRKPNKSAIRRGALPFDEYRVLVLKEHERWIVRNYSMGNHRSPREHLRRGHIRRLRDGRKVWVNPTVVNAGSIGKITTIYDARKVA